MNLPEVVYELYRHYPACHHSGLMVLAVAVIHVDDLDLVAETTIVKKSGYNKRR